MGIPVPRGLVHRTDVSCGCGIQIHARNPVQDQSKSQVISLLGVSPPPRCPSVVAMGPELPPESVQVEWFPCWLYLLTYLPHRVVGLAPKNVFSGLGIFSHLDRKEISGIVFKFCKCGLLLWVVRVRHVHYESECERNSGGLLCISITKLSVK